MNKIKIAIWGDGLCEWEGGVQAMLNIIHYYTKASLLFDVEYLINVIIFENCVDKDVIIARCKAVNPDIYLHIVDGFRDGKNTVENIIHAQLIVPILWNVIRRTQVSYVLYIADLQEEYLPHFFDRKDILYRRINNEYCIRNSRNILVMSETVKRDIERIYSDSTKDKKIWCQPCAPLSNPAYWEDRHYLISKYGLLDNYFLVSNQFWQHKNHKTLFMAVRELVRHNNIGVVVVCTGDTKDFRNKEYIDELLLFIKDNQLENNIKILGYIPKDDQIELLKHAVAVVQPTLFEGGAGGFSGQEAVAYDRPLILSNIPINHELQQNDNVYYFDPYDYIKLSELMMWVLNNNRPYSLSKVQDIYKRNSEKVAMFYHEMTKSLLKE